MFSELLGVVQCLHNRVAITANAVISMPSRARLGAVLHVTTRTMCSRTKASNNC
jgi:hypothetical protein